MEFIYTLRLADNFRHGMYSFGQQS